jgi:general stress protein 26
MFYARLAVWNSAQTTNFHEMLYLSTFPKSEQKIQVSLKSDNNNGYFRRKPMYVYGNISLNSFRMRHVSKKIVEEIKTSMMSSVKYFRKSCQIHCVALSLQTMVLRTRHSVT